MRTLSILLMCAVTTACAVHLSFSDIKSGGTLEVARELVIESNNARVFLQYGKVVSYKEIKRFYPHCWFVSWQRINQSQTIRPGRFVISKVVEKVEMVARPGTGFRLALLGIQGGSPIAEYITELYLRSEHQPAIQRLICSHWEDPTDAQHLTGAQIQQALGEYARVISE